MPTKSNDIKVWFPVIKGGSGTDVYTIRLAKALETRGIASEITWFNPYYEFLPYLLRSQKIPDHVNVIHANAWNAFAFKRPGVPLIATEHHNVLDLQYRPFKNYAQHIYHQTLIHRFLARSMEIADLLTTVSHFTADSIARSMGIKSVRVIYNFVDTDIFRPIATANKRTDRKFKLLFVGNPTRRKGGDLFTPIMKELGEEFELYCTTGLRNLSTKHSTSNIVTTVHVQGDQALVELYNKCHALLFPTRFEGFGYAALEAMACGKPVIASNNSSLPEVIKDGETGILCPTDDVAAFAKACRTLAENKKLYEEYSSAARQRAINYFSEDVIISQYIALYREAINRFS